MTRTCATTGIAAGQQRPTAPRLLPAPRGIISPPDGAATLPTRAASIGPAPRRRLGWRTMSIAFRDTISPTLKRAAAGIKDKRPILEAMGAQLTSLTIRAFNDPSLRPAPWPAKSDGSPATLRKNQVLVHSIRIVKLTNSSVTVGTDRVYAAIHQLGGTIKPKHGKALRFSLGGAEVFAKSVSIPARPFFPFTEGRMTDLARERLRSVAQAKIAALFKAQGGGEA